MIAERIQTAIHKLDSDAGTRWVNYLLLIALVLALGVWYDLHCYHNFDSPEAMDAAQVARNLAEGHGFTTECVRPLSIHLLQDHHGAGLANLVATNGTDTAGMYGRHPDLANPPVYPLVLAGLMDLTRPDWKVDLHKPFWSDGGRFLRYKPEFNIALFNQLLLLVAVCLTFLVAKSVFDVPAARLAAVLMLCSETLWKYSVSGLPTLLLLVIFLGLIWCLASYEAVGNAEKPDDRRRFVLAAAVGALAAAGMLTSYSFGWVMLPVVIFFLLFGGPRGKGQALAAFLVWLVVIAPWLVRNFLASGTLFGTAGYAIWEDTYAFPGSHLMQSLNPDLNPAHGRALTVIGVKLQTNMRSLLRDAVPQLGGGWVGILFLAGLLLGLRNVTARRLRYFTMMTLGVFLVVTALGQTGLSAAAPEENPENLLVLLMPLAAMFGVAFLLTLMGQMNVPTVQVRYAVIVLVVLLLRAQFILTLLPPKTPTLAFPPYQPADIQKLSAWMQPDELVMSDIPWAVAWYGDRQCVWTTLNCDTEFDALHTFIKPVNGLYLSLDTLNGRFITEFLQGGDQNWSYFAYKALVFNHLPDKFPLRKFPAESMSSGIFVTDHARW